MKKIKLMTMVCAAAVLSCTKPSADLHPNHRYTPGVTEPRPVDTDITSIYDLNANAGYINSHAADWRSSSLELDRRTYMTLESPRLSAVNALYPRVKKMANGAWLLIYQQGPQAHDVYYATSNNFSSWKNAESQLFAKTDMNQYNSNVSDRVLYSSADAVVLDNGDVLAFASFRLNNGYRKNNLNNGIMMRRSSDNGMTWSDTTVIWRGTTWEPSALQLSNGEVHVYFTSSDPNKGDSGTALLRSNDRGKSWTYAGKVIRQESGTAADGSGEPVYTDQMPVAIQLNGMDRIAVAVESRFDKTYHLSMAYSDDDWASGGLAGNQTGPEDRKSNVFKNEAAPYIRQMRSGETLLTSGISGRLNVRIGDTRAEIFGNPSPVLEASGYWGAMELENDHVVVFTFPQTWTEDGTSHARIQLGKYILNHRINASEFIPEIDGSSKDWSNVQDALFIGSDSDASAVFRFSYSADSLYCLVERTDENLGTGDGFDLMIQSGNATGKHLELKFTFDPSGKELVCSNENIRFAANILGTADGIRDDRGYVAEIGIPRSMLNTAMDRILFNAVLYNGDAADTFTGLTSSNYASWLPVELKVPSEPAPGIEPGDGDVADGPVWGNGTEINPW